MDHIQDQHGDPTRIDLQWFGDGEGNPAQGSGEGAGGAGSLATELFQQASSGSGAAPASQEGAQGNGQPAGQQGAGQATEAQLAGWTAGLTKGLKSDPRIAAIAKFQSMDDAVKAYLELEGKQGSMIAIPTDKSTPEEAAVFYEKIGVPKTPAEYKLERDPNIQYDETQDAEFKQFLHDNHIPQATAAALYKQINERTAQTLAAYATRNAEAKKSLTADLQKEWGNDYGTNVQLVKRGMASYASQGLMERLEKSGMGNDKDLIVMFQKLGQLVQEDSAGKRTDAAHPAASRAGFDYPGLK